MAMDATFGFDDVGEIREVFCTDWKAGSDNYAIVSDACILLSLLLQHGYNVEDITARLCSPPSLIGALIAAAKELKNASV
jgi:hypothetical protein